MVKKENHILQVRSGLNGLQTVQEIEQDLKKLSKKYHVVINISETSFEKKFSPMLAKFLCLYDCEYTGLGAEREKEFQAIIQTGYFLKESMGTTKYLEWLQEKIEISDYPLMVLDTVLIKGSKVPYAIVQPMSFEKDYLRYRRLKPQYTEPYLLEEGILNNEDVWVTDTIHRLDLAQKDIGFRFASTRKEREIITILSNILSGRLVGFREGDASCTI